MMKKTTARKPKGNLVKEIDAAIVLLTRVRTLAASYGVMDGIAKPAPAGKAVKRVLSADAREAIAAAQRKRWAKRNKRHGLQSRSSCLSCFHRTTLMLSLLLRRLTPTLTMQMMTSPHRRNESTGVENLPLEPCPAIVRSKTERTLAARRRRSRVTGLEFIFCDTSCFGRLLCNAFVLDIQRKPIGG
jgi:hypothetical protein